MLQQHCKLWCSYQKQCIDSNKFYDDIFALATLPIKLRPVIKPTMGLLFCIIVLQLGLSWVRYYPNCNFWFVPKCHFAFSHVNRQTSYEKPAPKAKRPAPPPPTARQAAAEAKRREAEAAMRWPQAYNDDDDDQAEDDDEKPITPPPRPKRISERERDVWA
jgi:hypothetical protein